MIDITPVYPHYVAWLAENLRPEDLRELTGLTSAPPFSALSFSVRHSHYCRAVMVGYKVGGIFGVVRVTPEIGQPWLMCSPELDTVPLEAARMSKRMINEMRDAGNYKVLRNVVDMRNEQHVKWLEWCGAKIHGGPIMKHYRRFEITF